MVIRRVLVAAAAAVVSVGTVAVAPAAAQGKPDVVHVPAGTTATVVDGVCQGFDFREAVTSGQATQIIFDNGTLIATGHYTVTFTRLLPDGSDGPSITVNVSGQAKADLDAALAYTHGPTELERPDDPNTPGWDGQLLIINGSSVFSLDTQDVLSSTTSVRDLCAELA